MADELLSPAEIEVLLGRRAAADAQRVAPPQPSDIELQNRLAARLAPIHEHAASQFAADLTSLVRRAARVSPSAFEWIAASGFLDIGSDGATYCRRIDVAPIDDLVPIDGPWWLSISPPVHYAIVDCMLGGGREVRADLCRPPTEIERRLVDRAAKLLLSALRVAWHDTATLSLELSDLTSPSNRPGPKAIAAKYLRSHFALDLAGVRGDLCLVIPATTIATLFPRDCAGDASQACCSSAASGIRPSASSGEVIELMACLAETDISPDELAALELGDIIATDQQANDPILVSQDGELRFRAHLGSWQGRKALEIEQVLPPSGESDAPTSNGA